MQLEHSELVASDEPTPKAAIQVDLRTKQVVLFYCRPTPVRIVCLPDALPFGRNIHEVADILRLVVKRYMTIIYVSEPPEKGRCPASKRFVFFTVHKSSLNA
jgi:hypothetical protein